MRKVQAYHDVRRSAESRRMQLQCFAFTVVKTSSGRTPCNQNVYFKCALTELRPIKFLLLSFSLIMVDVAGALSSTTRESFMGRTRGALKSMRSALGGGGEYLQGLGSRLGSALSSSLEESELTTTPSSPSSPHPTAQVVNLEAEIGRRKLKFPRWVGITVIQPQSRINLWSTVICIRKLYIVISFLVYANSEENVLPVDTYIWFSGSEQICPMKTTRPWLGKSWNDKVA